jgi:CBS domain-containing protein
MQVRDIMTRTVVSAAPETSVLDLATLMIEKRISAVPIVSGGLVVGIVSEADLLHRYELGTERDPTLRSWWRRLLVPDDAPWSYVEAHAMKARDIMTMPVVSVSEDTPIVDVIAIFESNKIRRAPVLRSGSMVGIVSRADFVRALVARAKVRGKAYPKSRSDETIRRSLLAALQSQPWWRPDRCHMTVRDGTVHITGVVDSPSEKVAVRVAAESISGVRAVDDSRSLLVPTGAY